ncbi:M4 family metallopeptidase, partial [Bacillus sp. D-CC]
MAIVALTTGLALASIVPYEIGYAEEMDQMQVDVQEDSFRTGELTQPSQKTPENVVKDALKENTEHALSPKQVSGEKGVDYKVLHIFVAYAKVSSHHMNHVFEEP